MTLLELLTSTCTIIVGARWVLGGDLLLGHPPRHCCQRYQKQGERESRRQAEDVCSVEPSGKKQKDKTRIDDADAHDEPLYAWFEGKWRARALVFVGAECWVLAVKKNVCLRLFGILPTLLATASQDNKNKKSAKGKLASTRETFLLWLGKTLD